jgi:hypothetical protein
VYPRLDQLLQPFLSDALTPEPAANRCLRHLVGAPQVQADAAPDQVPETGLRDSAAPTQPSLYVGRYVMATVEHREPRDSRVSRTVLGAPRSEIPPRDSTITEVP